MLRLSNSFYNRSILSLHTGGQIGTAYQPLINPDNLKIEGWFAQVPNSKGEFVLPAIEVRDFITKGVVVNDHTAITELDDLVRLKDLIELRYDPIGKPVITESKKKLGKVADFAVADDFYIQKLYVNPPLFRGLSDHQLLVGRDEIIETTDKAIIVADATVKAEAGSPLKVEA